MNKPEFQLSASGKDFQIVRIAVPLALPSHLDYKVELLDSEETPVKAGAWVEVSVGNKNCHGLVTELVEKSPYKKLKTAKLLPVPNLASQTLKFYNWVSKYTLSMPGDAIRAALIAGKIPEEPAVPQIISWIKAPDKLTSARQKVIDTINSNSLVSFTSASQLAEASQVSVGVVSGLIKSGCLAWEEVTKVTEATEDKITSYNNSKKTTPVTKQKAKNRPSLSSEQSLAAGEIMAAIHSHKFTPFLLDGITGSGKTEVYFEAIEKILDDGEGVSLVLVPEISLTPQWIERFKARFGFEPVIWHSGLTPAQRRRNWWRISSGEAQIVIGARSAIFLPYHNLKLIVVDEEHDNSYKQEDVFRYHGRDMAIALASIWKCPVVLATATPSTESWHNASTDAQGNKVGLGSPTAKYKYLHLSSRHGEAVLPEIHLIDMRDKQESKARGKDKWLGQTSVDLIQEKLDKGEQTLVFLNRRGTAPLLICNACGHRQECPNCDASVVVHGNHLQCHHCGFQELWPEHCPKCKAEKKFKAFGPGTRKVLSELRELFPTANIDVADSDAIASDKQMGNLVERMSQGKIDILVGTQMMAKGHDFPNLTLVCVVDSDMGLAHGELRSAENTFQLLVQVAGRAGRAKKKGTVLLQTHDPEHPLFSSLLAGDRDGFLNRELQSRKDWNDPPFSRQVAILLDGIDEGLVSATARHLVKQSAKISGVERVEILGPAPASLSRLKNRFRYRILVKTALKANNAQQLHAFVKNWLSSTPLASRVRVLVDVDPR